MNFIRRLMPNFDELMKPILKLFKKDVQFKWCDKESKGFKMIKEAIERSLVLISPDYSKYF